ncbi:hypothetical protein L1987_03166 [Smallanthus sonchifolius]|uniref:Uncharacterized protein n=1 Tax=Smallanthus sonchifolius TaxID=185202 RepID=A0ACB9K9T7_9ASTR|nr:hypothetical protein L1987_03166 [Smallanthus sonchifolius]
MPLTSWRSLNKYISTPEFQFNREVDGPLKPMHAKHMDTGMGFERLTSILHSKMNNYDPGVFLPIFYASQQTKVTPIVEGYGGWAFRPDGYAVIVVDGPSEYPVITEFRVGNDGLGVIVTPGTVAYVTTGG